MYKKYFIEKIFLKIYYIFTSLYFSKFHKIHLGKNCKIALSATIRGNVILGNNVTIGKYTNITGNVFIGDKTYIGDYSRLNTMIEGSITIENNCHINVYNIIGSSEKVFIKKNALFAAGVKITDASHKIDDITIMTKDAVFTSKEVIIGENCWLGFDVNIIMGGQIGQNCVIGSKAVVNKKIPSNSIAVGIPAKVIKKRDTIEK